MNQPDQSPLSPSANDSEQLLDTRRVAELLRFSVSALRREIRAGNIPAPGRIGRNLRWRRKELVAWIEAGYPDRATWEALRAILFPAARESPLAVNGTRKTAAGDGRRPETTIHALRNGIDARSIRPQDAD
jgi:predicted DNA-binding transcriptional regulator AlpA